MPPEGAAFCHPKGVTPLLRLENPMPRQGRGGHRIRRMREAFHVRRAYCRAAGAGLYLFPCETCRGGRPCPPAAPQAQDFCDCTAVPFFTATLQLCLRRPYLFPLAGKDMEEKDAGERNSAYARKGVSLHSTCYRYTSSQGTPFGRPSNWVSASHESFCLLLDLCPLNI